MKSPTQFRTHWKDSMSNDVHPEFQRKFHSRVELDKYKQQHGIREAGTVSKEHMKRVTDFVAYYKEEKKKDPNWKCKERYPDQRGYGQKER